MEPPPGVLVAVERHRGIAPLSLSRRPIEVGLRGRAQVRRVIVLLLVWLLWAYSRCGVSTGVLIGLCAASLRGLATVSRQLWSLSG